MTNLKPVDVAIVGGGWTGLAMAKELVTRTSSTSWRSNAAHRAASPTTPWTWTSSTTTSACA